MVNIDRITIKLSEQKLYVLDKNRQIIKQYPVSSSIYGTGNQSGSYQTPLGEHIVAEKIGANAPMMEVFVGREPKGLLPELLETNTQLPEDIITSRIMWLQGQEPGINKGGDVDSYTRYIYIHGTSEEDKIGNPASHGCIRMINSDVVELFDLIETGCPVHIEK